MAEQTQDRPRRRRVIAAAGVALIGASAMTVAGAASIATLSSDTLATNSSTFTTCPGISTELRTRYVAASTRYEIAQILLTSVPAACQSKSYRVTVAQGDSSGTSLAELTGTTSPGSSTTITFASGTGPTLNSINNTVATVKVVVVIAS